MNWGQLKAAVAAYSHRPDLTAMFPTFLAFAEQRIYIGEANAPKVRCAAMRQSATLADGTRPAGFLEAIKIAPESKPESPLIYKPLANMPCEFQAFSWDGPTLVLSREQAFPVDMTYYARLTSPVADGDTNWLMTNAPGVYLASLLVEVYRWAVDDKAAAREAGNYASAANSINSQERAAQISGSRLVMSGASR
jgi:hypothetical protein